MCWKHEKFWRKSDVGSVTLVSMSQRISFLHIWVEEMELMDADWERNKFAVGWVETKFVFHDDESKYRNVVVKLLYLSTTRTYTSFFARWLSQHVSKSQQVHYQAAITMLQHLKSVLSCQGPSKVWHFCPSWYSLVVWLWGES